MSDAEGRLARWNQRWSRRDYADTVPVEVLTRYAYLLPPSGVALDLACGLGANALLLAERGLESHAWDYSAVAIERLREMAGRRGLAVHAEVHDLMREALPAGRFDVIVVSRFLERSLCRTIAAALRPGGLLYYQSFVREQVSGNGPEDQAFRLAPNELLHLFPELLVRVFHDEGRLGDTRQGVRDETLLVAQRGRPAEAG